MYPFVETIRVEDGVPHNLRYHQLRMADTMRRFFPHTPVPSLASELEARKWPAGITWKVHVEYDARGITLFKADEYHIRHITRLRLVVCDDIDYAYKSADRRRLETLFAQRGKADEVVIVRNGLLTDTSYSNIALFDGCHWVTPRQPLLRGTMRQSLLDAGVLTEQDIKAEDWRSYRQVSLINAMMPLGRLVCKI